MASEDTGEVRVAVRGLRTAGLLALSVALGVAAHPPASVWPLAFLMWGPLAVAVEGRRAPAAFAMGWLVHTGIGLAISRWTLHALTVEYEVPLVAAWVAWLGVVGPVQLVPAAGVALYAALRPRASLAAAPLLFACCTLLAEWVRAGPVGLPWVLTGHAVARVPLLLQTAEWGGAWAVGLPLAAVGAGAALAVATRSARPLALPLALVALASAWGALRLGTAPAPADAGGRAVEVAVVQASVPPDARFRTGSALANTMRHAAITRGLVETAPPDLVVWSETAVDADLDAEPRLRALLGELVAETGVPLVTGAPRSPNGRPVNAVVLVVPEGGLVETYAKQRLVPFSEYDPVWGAPLAALLAPLVEGAGYEPGREPTVFRAGPLPFATPVCFEITYPDLVRAFRSAGAQLLVNVSNDAWFGRTGYAEMHLRHAVLRAVELRTWVVRAANTGISAVIDPQGRVVASLGLFEEGTLRAEVVPTQARTLYLAAGDAPVVALLALVAGLCVARPPQKASAGSG